MLKPSASKMPNQVYTSPAGTYEDIIGTIYIIKFYQQSIFLTILITCSLSDYIAVVVMKTVSNNIM